MKRLLILAAAITGITDLSASASTLVTMENDPRNLLRTAAVPVTDFAHARTVAEQMKNLRKELGGGAGLAANQAGFNLAMFIYTPDRTDAKLQVVINPSFESVGDEVITGEEACYSEPLRCSTLGRWKTIKVRYQTLEQVVVEEMLTGFAAKVFQHEMDHLRGELLSTNLEAWTIEFDTKEAFEAHLAKVKTKDSENYSR